MKRILSLLCLLCCAPLAAQTSLGDYRRAVLRYSWQLKAAAARTEAAAQRFGQARTGFLPQLSLDGSFSATVRRSNDAERWTFSVLPQLVQVVYGGGSVRAAVDRARAGYDIALCDEEFSRLEIGYAADYAYWNLSALELYAAAMRQYVRLIVSLKEVVDRRFEEGYIAKGDVLMIDARLSEARYQLVTAEQRAEVALHNFNILQGADASAPVRLTDSVRDSILMPQHADHAEALERRPDYAAAQMRIEQSRPIGASAWPGRPSIRR